jgi:hypothetical protein
MAFDIGTTMPTTGGYGFAIRNTHKGPITTIEFATREEAERAEAAVRAALKDAIAVTDTTGKIW